MKNVQKGKEMKAYSKLLWLALLPLSVAAGTLPTAYADGLNGGLTQDEPLVLKKTISVGAKLTAFDISFVDPKIELYILADRTNASVDLFDSEQAKFIGRVGSVCPTGNPAPHFCFQGVVLKPDGTPNNDLSGPDGDIVVDHKEIWAGDGDSRVKVIDLATRSFVTTISTGGKFRVDEMAYDPRDHLLAAANNADDPPFVTMFDTQNKAIKGKLVFQSGSTNANVDATNGIEQPQWSPRTGMFYVSVPQVGKDPSVGGVSVIDPVTMKVTGTFLVSNCSPAGLAIGPNHQALVGCSGAFGKPATTRSVIIDTTSTDFTHVDGAVVASVPIGGSDEVWYDAGTQHYFLAARSNTDATGKVTPILGSIDALTNKLDPSAPSSSTAHSVAADRYSHYVFLPIGAVSSSANDPNNPCSGTGCIAVFRAQTEPGRGKIADLFKGLFSDHH